MNLEHHHRRIHWKMRLVHWATAPLAIIAAFAWLYISQAACQEDGDAIGTVCHVSRVIPFLPVLAGLALLAFVVWDLTKVGHEHLHEKGARPGPRALKHAVHGYRAISHPHRRHIHWAVIIVAAAALTVGLWIAWLAYQTTR